MQYEPRGAQSTTDYNGDFTKCLKHYTQTHNALYTLLLFSSRERESKYRKRAEIYCLNVKHAQTMSIAAKGSLAILFCFSSTHTKALYQSTCGHSQAQWKYCSFFSLEKERKRQKSRTVTSWAQLTHPRASEREANWRATERNGSNSRTNDNKLMNDRSNERTNERKSG